MKIETVIGILTYNQLGFLTTCLRSISLTSCGYQLVIANNNAGLFYSGEVNKLARQFGATCIQFSYNRGTSAAWNAIARMYDCRKVAILNDDIKVYPGWQQVMDHVLSQGGIGSMSFSLAPWTHENNCQFETSMVKNLSYYRSIYPYGAFLMFRKEVFEQVGGFDENFWIGCEEVDFGIRAIWKGYSNYNVGAPEDRYRFASHYGGGTGFPPEEGEKSKAYFRQKYGLDFTELRTYEDVEALKLSCQIIQ